MTPKPEYIYIAFDLFPSKKGASTHINHCLKALQASFKTGLLICLGNEDMPSFQFDKERNLYVYRWKKKVVNFLERTDAFQNEIHKLFKSDICSQIKLVHFRDIWGGIPAIKHFTKIPKLFEINAFTSIELPNRYPGINASVIKVLKERERFCVTNSTAIISPSKVTKAYIHGTFNVPQKKVTVIPNGVTVYNSKPIKTPKKQQILYFGALQKWQGIKTLFKALKELNDLEIRLLICSSIPEKRTAMYKELSVAIGVDHKIDWCFELDKKQLAKKIRASVLSVAPLKACDRNLIQGCNPLKILESMAYGTPVMASNIPVVRELITNKSLGFLVYPDRPEILGRTIRKVLETPEILKEVGCKSQIYIEKNYLWKYQEAKMTTLYKTLTLNV